jgi:hypothetical protein
MSIVAPNPLSVVMALCGDTATGRPLKAAVQRSLRVVAG